MRYILSIFHAHNQDLHRTGCQGFNGDNSENERACLKRVLLAYARWNKRVGYCQGFNIIAALILDVVDRCEEDALKVSYLSPFCFIIYRHFVLLFSDSLFYCL